eukprot:3093051-Prymnesium_polylepis.1
MRVQTSYGQVMTSSDASDRKPPAADDRAWLHTRVLHDAAAPRPLGIMTDAVNSLEGEFKMYDFLLASCKGEAAADAEASK